MAVPLSCLKKDKLCSKMLFFNTNSAKSISESIDIVLSSLDIDAAWGGTSYDQDDL